MTRADRPGGGARVLLVDDHHVFRSGLRELLERHGQTVVGEAVSCDQALRRAAERRHDVVLLDVGLPDGSGVALIPQLLRAAPGSVVLVLSGSRSDDDLVEALYAGASGYLLKDAGIDEIVRAIAAANRGGGAISPELIGGLVRHLRGRGAAGRAAEDPGLTPREREVLRLVIAGRENPEIAAELFLSVGTVKADVAALLAKLGVENRVQAAVEAVRRGIV